MDNFFVNKNIDNKFLPKVKDIDTTSGGGKIEFVPHQSSYIIKIFRNPPILGNTKKFAEVLAEHMDIIEESRKEIKNGNTMSWSDFVNSHGSKKK